MAEHKLTPTAQRDLDRIFEYTVQSWGLPQALRYTDLIEAICARMAESPLSAPSCEHMRPGYRRRSVEEHVIYYRLKSYGIEVVRILHQRMDHFRHL